MTTDNRTNDDERLPRLEERMAAAVARTDGLAETLRDFRRESGEQHKALELKIDEVVDGIAAEKKEKAARVRVAVLAFSAPVLSFLLAILYTLAAG